MADPIYRVTIDGDEVVALDDGQEIDYVVNGQDTFTFKTPLLVDSPRYEMDQEVILYRDATPIFRGPISAVPEEGEGGPNDDSVSIEITATSSYICTTYRYLTLTIPSGTVKAALVAMLAYLEGIGPFFGVTLDPAQIDGVTLPELVFTRKRVDEAISQISDLTQDAGPDGGYIADITPDNLYLRMYPPGTYNAPYNILDSDTGDAKQVGDLTIEPTRNDTYANRIRMVVSGGGPATSQETFLPAQGVSGGGYTRFALKYPMADAIGAGYPNQLYFDGVPQGPIGFGIGTAGWSWDFTTKPGTLAYNESSGANYPTTGQVISYGPIGYTIGYPFEVVEEDVPAQAAPTYVRERIVTVPDGMPYETARSYARSQLSKRAISFKRARFSSLKIGWEIGQVMTITVAARATNAVFLITAVKMLRESDSGQFIYQVEALEGTNSQANWRDTPKAWLGGASSSSGGVSVGPAAVTGGLLKFAQLQLSDTATKALGDSSSVILAALTGSRRAKPVSGTLRVKTAVAYTGINAGAVLAVKSGAVVLATVLLNEAGSPGVTDLSDVLGASVDKTFDFPVPAMRVSGSTVLGLDPAAMGNTSALVNAALELALDNGGDGPLTGGDAANSVTLDIWYVEESLTVPPAAPAVLAFSGYADSAWKFMAADGTAAADPTAGAPGAYGQDGIVALDDGTVCMAGMKSPANSSPNFYNWGVFDLDFAAFASGDTAGPTIRSIASDYTSAFYSIRTNGSTVSKIYKFDNTGTKVAEWDISSSALGFTAQVLGMTSDESFAYISAFNGDTVYKWDIGGVSETSFAVETGYQTKLNNILVLRSGEVLIAWDKSGSGSGYVKHYDASGSLLYTYALAGTDSSPVVLTPGADDDSSFWVGYYNSDAATYSGITISEIETVTGTVLNTFDPDDGTFEFDGPFCLLRAPFA